jgi:predicted porin
LSGLLIKTNMRTPILSLVFLAAVTPGFAADVDEILEAFELYGSLRGHVAGFDGEQEVQDNSSRVGVDFSREFGEKLTVVAGAEFSLNLFDSDFQFNLDAGTDTGFVTVSREEAGQVFGTRLGRLGLDLGRWGRVTIGKQWSVYSDVSRYTDTFDVFGKEASGTYRGGTDGGALGTGRADNAIIYRNRFGKLRLGAQTQPRGDANDGVTDGYGASLQAVLSKRWTVGGAFNRSRVDNALFPITRGLTDDPSHWVAGVRYDNDSLHVALTYSKQENGDFVTVEDPATMSEVSIVFDAEGIEASGVFELTERVHVTGGFNHLRPERLDPLLDPGFERKTYIAGARYMFDDRTYAYFEARLDDSTTATGAARSDVVTLGLRYDFTIKKKSGDE